MLLLQHHNETKYEKEGKRSVPYIFVIAVARNIRFVNLHIYRHQSKYSYNDNNMIPGTCADT